MAQIPTRTQLRDRNRARVLRTIAQRGPVARTEIAAALGLSAASVTAITRELIEEGMVHVVEQAPSRGGRPAILLGLVGGAATALGVKIAPDHLVGVRGSLDGEVLDRFEQPFDGSLPRLAHALGGRVDDAHAGGFLLGVGLGLPGIVGGGADAVVDSPMLGWRGVHAARRLADALGVPVVVDNDVNTLAVAELLYGRGRGVDDFVTVTIGRGVGLGVVARGELYRGARGGAGEFGHLPVDPGGPVCECGNRGCLEALVADPALVARGRELGLLAEEEGISVLRSLAAGGDVRALALFAEAGSLLGRATAGVVNLLDPQLVLVSGEGTQSWPYVGAAFVDALERATFAPLRGVAVEVDPWDDAKWALGAAALVLRTPFAAEGVHRDVRARLRRRAAELVGADR